MKKALGQLLVLVLITSVIFILLGFFILKTPDHHEILIRLFSEIVVLIICSFLIIHATDRYIISLDEQKKNKLMRTLAFILPVFYQLGHSFSKKVAYVAKVILEKI